MDNFIYEKRSGRKFLNYLIKLCYFRVIIYHNLNYYKLIIII